MANEDTLAAIPTDQLMLRLLQELVARVDRLEQANKPTNKDGSPKMTAKSTDTPKDNTTVTDVPDEALSSSKINTVSTDSRCATCDEIIGELCECVSIPYGYMLHDEIADPNVGYNLPPPLNYPGIKGLTHIEDRVRGLELEDPRRAERFEEIGFAGIPDDGRLPFKNFWILPADSLDSALLAIDKIRSVDGHRFWVLDIDSTGNGMIYGPSNFYNNNTYNTRYRPQIYPIYGENLYGLGFNTPGVRCDDGDPHRNRRGLWKRLIVITGLAATDPVPLSNFSGSDIFADPKDFSAMEMHIRSDPSYCVFLKLSYNNNFIFHLSWYQALDPSQACARWKKGRLRGDTTDIISEMSFTIEMSSDFQNRFWTILILAPPGGHMRSVAIDQQQDEAWKTFNVFPLLLILAKMGVMPLEQAYQGWLTLASYIDSLLGTGEEIFDIETHDNLIFDDDLYTRSRQYFWVINFTNKAEIMVEGNVEAWQRFRDDILGPFDKDLEREGKKELRRELNDAIEACEEWSTKLKQILEQFREQRTKVVALRDGLFSASAVMESRASTRLGENVKLLTYVSIFYLPLAFCTSIWSTTDTFGYHNLIITMVVVGFVTYMVVFNLNQIVKLWKSNYHRLKSSTIGKMREDESETWSDRGDLFHKYKPRNTNEMPKPSEWWIPVYILRRMVDLSWLRGEDQPVEDNTSTLGRKWYSKIFGYKKQSVPPG